MRLHKCYVYFQVLLYIVPTILFSIVINVPRFFELKMQEFEVDNNNVEESGNNSSRPQLQEGIKML